MDIEIRGDLSKLNGNTYMNTFKILGDFFIFTLVGCLRFLLVHLEMPSSQY